MPSFRAVPDDHFVEGGIQRKKETEQLVIAIRATAQQPQKNIYLAAGTQSFHGISLPVDDRQHTPPPVSHPRQADSDFQRAAQVIEPFNAQPPAQAGKLIPQCGTQRPDR